MSTSLDTRTSDTLTWITADELCALGFAPGGPETDLGMRWGSSATIRASYAPHIDRSGGYLYAHDPSTDRYALLCPETTRDAVDSAWRLVLESPDLEDGHLALADIVDGERSLRSAHARALWLHCVEQEFTARRDYDTVKQDPTLRVDAARTVVISESARCAAEQLLHDACVASGAVEPVSIRYRIPTWPHWSGRVTAPELSAGVSDLIEVRAAARRAGYQAQATSVTHGHSVVSAARVPEVQFAALPAQPEIIASRHMSL